MTARKNSASLIAFQGAPGAYSDLACREVGCAEKHSGLDPRERTSALVRQLESTAAVSERAGEIAPQPQHLAEKSVRPVQSFETALLLVGEESVGSGAVASGSLRVRERRQDAWLVPQRGAPRAR